MDKDILVVDIQPEFVNTNLTIADVIKSLVGDKVICTKDEHITDRRG